MELGLINVCELKKILKYRRSSIYLIDVRDEEEYKCGCIEGAVNIPSNMIYETECGNYVVLNKLKNIKSYGFEIILYCKSGSRSMRCVKILEDYGINCFSLHGGADKYGINDENGV